MADQRGQNYRWYVLTLTSLIGFAFGAAWTCMPALFREIAEDFSLSLAEIGMIWGTVPLAGAFLAILGGLLGDRFGIRLVIGLAALAAGVATLLRGLSTGLTMLVIFMLIYGAFQSLQASNRPKVVRTWFDPRQLALTNNLVAIGFMLGSALAMMFSGTILSPALGGWQNVIYLYGAILLLFGLLWLLTVKEQAKTETAGEPQARKPQVGVPFKEAFSKVTRMRDVWLIAATLFAITAAQMGPVGYMPTYFAQNAGLPEQTAHSIASLFLWISLPGGIIISIISDKLGLRKAIYVPCAVISAITLLAIPMVASSAARLAIIVSVFGFFGGTAYGMPLMIVTEMKTIGAVYAGTAVGLALTAGGIGGFISPILGGALAESNPTQAFIFWAVMSFVAATCILITRETGMRAQKAGQ